MSKATRFAISEKQFNKIKKALEKGKSVEKVMEDWDISKSTFDRIKNAKIYKEYAMSRPATPKEVIIERKTKIIRDSLFVNGFLVGVIFGTTLYLIMLLLLNMFYSPEVVLDDPEQETTTSEQTEVAPVNKDLNIPDGGVCLKCIE